MSPLLQPEFPTEDLQALPVWRYVTLEKFVPLLEFSAMWFPRLDIMQDTFEGGLPTNTKDRFLKRDQEIADKFAEIFPRKSFVRPLIEMTADNIESGRKLIVINCWNQEEEESPRMWADYVGQRPGLAIKTTVGVLGEAFYLDPQYSRIGRVRYVDFEKHDLPDYEANQANHRAFHKRPEFAFENEIRLMTLNWITPVTLNPDGSYANEIQRTGAHTWSEDQKGIYLRVDLPKLIARVVIAPNAPPYMKNLVVLMCARHGLRVSIGNSKFR